jgi:hypothetical protein
MQLTRHRGWIRFGLIYVAVTTGLLAAWILITPKGFYDDFPGGSSHWVSVLPPYNEHLERDFGAASLGLAVLASLAALWMEKGVVQVAAITILVAGIPHLAYHATTTEHLSTGDNVGSLAGLALDVLLPLAVLYLAGDRAQGRIRSAGPPEGRPRPTPARSR